MALVSGFDCPTFDSCNAQDNETQNWSTWRFFALSLVLPLGWTSGANASKNCWPWTSNVCNGSNGFKSWEMNPKYNMDVNPKYNLNANPKYNLNVNPKYNLNANPKYNPFAKPCDLGIGKKCP